MAPERNEQSQRIMAANMEYGEAIANLSHRCALLRSEIAARDLLIEEQEERIKKLEAETPAA